MCGSKNGTGPLGCAADSTCFTLNAGQADVRARGLHGIFRNAVSKRLNKLLRLVHEVAYLFKV